MSPEAGATARVEYLGDRESTELVHRAQQGDRPAFEELYRRNVGRVYAVVLRIMAKAQDAEELTQKVFIRAWMALGSFRGESLFSSWLHRLAVNTVLMHLREERRRMARVVETEDAVLREGNTGNPSPESRIDLEEAIRALPRGARAILVLHDIEGYTHDEIARLLGIAPGTCKAQLHRARQLLREVLKR